MNSRTCACRALASATTLCGRDARRRQAWQRPHDGSPERLDRWFSEYLTWRGHSVGHPFVVSARPPDLLDRAKHLLDSANVNEPPGSRSGKTTQAMPLQSCQARSAAHSSFPPAAMVAGGRASGRNDERPKRRNDTRRRSELFI